MIALVAGVAGLAGVIAMIISSTMSTANSLVDLPLLIVAGVVGVALCAVAYLVKNDYVSLASSVGAVLLFVYALGNTLAARVLMIAGLFSYNQGNTEGWNVFYVVIASVVLFVVACVALIVDSFLKPKKK